MHLPIKHLNRLPPFGLLFFAVFWFTGCEYLQPLPTQTARPTATSTPTPTPTTNQKAEHSGAWQQLQPGLERRTLEIVKAGQILETLFVLRLQPDYFRFGVAYDPHGLTLDSWQAQTGALVVVNGGFFRLEDEIYIPNGLTVIDGIAMGESYADFGGMLAVLETGLDLRWLAQQPYHPGEPLLAALQSFPILVKPGGGIGFPAEHEDHISARRTVIAKDTVGRILLIVAPQGNLSLHQLSAYLTNTDLDIDIAINLDGGPSSGILLADPPVKIPAVSPLPIVITVHKR